MPSRNKRAPTPRCSDCGSLSLAGSFEGRLYCAVCIHPYATRVTHTCEEFVRIAEDLVRVAETYDSRAARTPVRAAEKHSTEVKGLLEMARAILPGLAERIAAERANLPLGDELLADAVKETLDEDRWGLTEWLDEPLALHCMVIAADSPDASLYHLLGSLFGGRGKRTDVTTKMVRAALLGERISLAELKKEPHRGRLRALNALAWAHGLVRMAHLSTSLELGHPPADPFTKEERDLYRRVVPEKVRRISRAFFLFSRDADFIKEWNDRAERLAELWLLHPVTDRLSKYMAMLHSAYVDDRHAEAVVLSRAILERAIADSCLVLGVIGDDRMNARLNALETTKQALSARAAAMARAVWQRGNKVVHQDPEFVRDSFETVEYLLFVLDELHEYLEPQIEDESEDSERGV